jgi:hypothetical protein
MERILDFWDWAANEQRDNALLFVVAWLLPVLLAIAWLLAVLVFFLAEQVFFGGLLLLAPIVLIVMRGVRQYNSEKDE